MMNKNSAFKTVEVISPNHSNMPQRSLQIDIDLTPLRPGGENGGAKVLVLSLLQELQRLSPKYRFLILTASWNHSELIKYKTKNTSFKLVASQDTYSQLSVAESGIFLTKINKIFNRIINKLNLKSYIKNDVLKSQNIDLLFCPFSAPTYAQKSIPLVAIAYDLQHLDYPFFFSTEEKQHRENFLTSLVNKSQNIICISDFTRQSFIQKLDVPEEKLDVVPICIQERLPKLTDSVVKKHLISLNLAGKKYAFYPANYWQHKNHRFLLTAYGIYKKQFPHNCVDLVFTGALEDEENQLREAVELMGLSENVHFLGFLNEEVLASVWQGSRCLIFPSLYEGFGIPILEAMRFGKPVLCSNTASLPEVAGDAAFYFNPRKLDEIVSALAQVTTDEVLIEQLVKKGYQRLELFNQQQMARQYLKIFENVVCNQKDYIQTMVAGIYDDGWSAPEFNIAVEAGSPGRNLVLTLEAPGSYPANKATVKLKSKGKKATYKFLRNTSQEIIWPLSQVGEVITVQVRPSFKPVELNLNSDTRQLGVVVRNCQVKSTDGTSNKIFTSESVA
ncbi:MAG: glycosyltransferase family 1 protein [Cyanobacteria bacterium J06632_19]